MRWGSRKTLHAKQDAMRWGSRKTLHAKHKMPSAQAHHQHKTQRNSFKQDKKEDKHKQNKHKTQNKHTRTFSPGMVSKQMGQSSSSQRGFLLFLPSSSNRPWRTAHRHQHHAPTQQTKQSAPITTVKPPHTTNAPTQQTKQSAPITNTSSNHHTNNTRLPRTHHKHTPTNIKTAPQRTPAQYQLKQHTTTT
jgi:hypothetical protein